MKALFLVLSLVAGSAFATEAAKPVASVEVSVSVPGHPRNSVSVYSDGTVQKFTCPINPTASCKVVIQQKLSSQDLTAVIQDASGAANGPEDKPRPIAHCNAIGQETRTYSAVAIDGQSIEVAKVNSPCMHVYRNEAAKALVGELNKLLNNEE